MAPLYSGAVLAIVSATFLYLGEHLKEAKGLLVGRRQRCDEAALLPRAPEEHAAPPAAPHGAAARLQAAGLPARGPASPVC